MRKPKGYPFYKYVDGYIVYRNEEYWGRVSPLFIELYLVSPEGNIEGETSKRYIRADLKRWGEIHGKKSKIKY